MINQALIALNILCLGQLTFTEEPFKMALYLAKFLANQNPIYRANAFYSLVNLVIL
jgi:hypothetical protein